MPNQKLDQKLRLPNQKKPENMRVNMRVYEGKMRVNSATKKPKLSNTKSNEGITPVLLPNDTFNDTLREKNDTKFYKKAI